MSPFINNMSELLTPLRELTHKDIHFDWTSSHEQRFIQIKNTLCRTTSLAYYDPTLPTVIQVDASGNALGAVLLQNERPICFASRTLTPAEKRYANIERELLAVVFGCERFHHFVFGIDFTIESDHKPLEMIILKHIASAPAQLLLRLQSYHLSIHYKPGKELTIADALSRDKSNMNTEHEEKNEEKIYHINAIKITALTTTTIILAGNDDEEHQRLRKYIFDGWPLSRRDVQKELRHHWSYRDELIEDRGLVYKGAAVLVLGAARDKILQKLHRAHQGAAKMILLARDTVFWNSMRQDLQRISDECESCQKYARAPWKPAPTVRTQPTRPWEHIAADLFQLDNKTYLLIADYFTKYPIIHQLPYGSSAATVVQKMKQSFSLLGIPTHVFTDNGPQFSAPAFEHFSNTWEFTHITSSPYYPQSNGFIERQVQNVNNVIKKNTADLDLAMLTLRQTPISDQSPSPLWLLTHQSLKKT